MFYLSGEVLSFSNILLRRDSKKYFILSKTMVSKVRLFLENGCVFCEGEQMVLTDIKSIKKIFILISFKE